MRTVASLILSSLLVGTLTQAPLAMAGEWKPGAGPLATRWAKDVSPERVHPEYPRPQLERPEWLNLNGLWDYAILDEAVKRPEAGQFAGQILVPFPIESSLSGVMKPVSDKQRLWYRRSFQAAPAWQGKTVLLHFGAVDWSTEVFVNGKSVGRHEGGYDPFTFDITDALKDGQQELLVAVADPTDASTQPRGKQVRKPEGIWYTPTTGIWQTVWIEPVPRDSIQRLKITPSVSKSEFVIELSTRGSKTGMTWNVVALDGTTEVGSASAPVGEKLHLPITKPKLWSPDTPFLYNLKVELRRDGKAVDTVASYAGLRDIALAKDERGVPRLMLNGKPLFQFGPLDQGFWPDGLYTAPTDEALRFDIEVTRKMGFNMCRKHVKVEPDRWYYWCDKLGLLVWQDMPSGDRYIGANDPDIKRSTESAANFERELKLMIEAFYNHPSIVMWVPFNEGWGQYNTAKIADYVKELDPSRLVNSVSGWADRKVGDVHDIHVYPGPGSPPREERRAAVLGEFGGLGLPIKGHTWQNEKNWGYRSFETRVELIQAYEQLIARMRPLIHDPGLAAAVYTQTTDVEIEVNGLMTYDRGDLKIPFDKLSNANRKVYLPPPVVREVLPTARKKPATWKYSLEKPADSWIKPEFDDSKWEEGPSGFGEPSTPGSTVGTMWKSPDIWLRRTIELPADINPRNLQMVIHHDEDAEVYLQGTLASKVTGFTTDYVIEPLKEIAVVPLQRGSKVTIAIHCHQTGGGQYIDIGLIEVTEKP